MGKNGENVVHANQFMYVPFNSLNSRQKKIESTWFKA
jgi:hypothetical protein